jgi:hydroxyacylglutathione hydrolase
MITVKDFTFNQLCVNTLVLSVESGDCLIIDPGCNTSSQQRQLADYIFDKQLKPVGIINTHGHFDHIFGNAWAKSVFNCPIIMHKDDVPLVEHADKFAGIFGFTIDRPPDPDQFLNDGDQVRLGDSLFTVIHVPGHSPGSICLYARHEQLLIGGDVLFSGSIGRTDLPGGDHQLLISGIQQKLMTLPKNNNWL